MFSNPYLSIFNCFSFDKLSPIRKISKKLNKKTNTPNQNIYSYYNKNDKQFHPYLLSPSSHQHNFDKTFNGFFSKKMLLNHCSKSLMYKSLVNKLQDKQFKLNKLNKSCGTSTTFYLQNKSENPCGKNKKLISNLHRYYNNLDMNQDNLITNKLLGGTFYKSNTRNFFNNTRGDCFFKNRSNKGHNVSYNKNSFYEKEVHNGSWSGMKRKDLNNNHSLVLPRNKLHIRQIVFNGEDKESMIVKQRMCVILQKRSNKEQGNGNNDEN